MSPFSPEGRRVVDEYEQRMRERARMGVGINSAPIPGARSFTLEHVGPGWRLGSTQRFFEGEDDIELAQPVGGLCVEVIHRTKTDFETGELFDVTAFRCLASWRPSDPWHHLTADEVDLTQLAGLDRIGATGAIRWLLRDVVHSNRRGLTPLERRALEDAWRLTVALG
jgi:hypothetical protein